VVSGLSHTLLLELVGVLPAELGSVAYQLHAARELREGLERVKHWVDQAIDIADTPPAAQVASTLLARSKDWAVSIRPAPARAALPHPATHVLRRGVTAHRQSCPLRMPGPN
jgi:hypothetical protein